MYKTQVQDVLPRGRAFRNTLVTFQNPGRNSFGGALAPVPLAKHAPAFHDTKTANNTFETSQRMGSWVGGL